MVGDKMPSQIKPNSIDATYPVAGVSQPTQGFRTNFLAIQNAFKETALELEDLVNKTIVSAPLTYGNSNVYINNFGGMNNSNLSLTAYADSIYDHGEISGSSTIDVDMSAGTIHTFSLSTSSVQTINVENFPGLGYSKIVLSVTANATPQYIDFSTIYGSVSAYPQSTTGSDMLYAPQASNANLRLDSSYYNYLIDISSEDGTNWFVQIENPPEQMYVVSVPTTSIGSAGDCKGMVAYDYSYLYLCNGYYDGSTQIWRRIVLSTF
jgi:hypothetical protein